MGAGPNAAAKQAGVAGVRSGGRIGFGFALGNWAALAALYKSALQREIDERRPFLWLPVAAGAGVVLYLGADREPVLWVAAAVTAALAAIAVAARRRRPAFALALACAAVLAGFTSAACRGARVAAPVLDRIRIVHLAGYIEEMDFRRTGARFVLRVASSTELSGKALPYRVRLTTKRTPEFEAGAFVAVTARLLPPAHAVIPDGYDFARDAYFQRIGAVGSVLGEMEERDPPAPPDTVLAAGMALDRFRNALARRVDRIVGGDAGAIAAAMVTGKRDLLSEDARDLIREAGIFHIITISGVQMTLVAGILFFTLRRAFALSSTLALRYPIKKWAALGAMAGACAYDIATGSRVGTERALFMTLIMLASVLADRRAFTMRNLAYAAFLVILLEPEAILGASFQLSFAAVAALVAVQEARARRGASKPGPAPPAHLAPVSGLGRLLFATLCATSATASFMAADFHELSPYVLIGNPLTLGLIELFAVPGALLGTALVPFGLDAPVWAYLGLGIRIILRVARFIADAPGATLHLGAFAPWALVFLSLAVLSAVIWRTLALRLTALPLLGLGIWGAFNGPHYDVLIPPSGDAVAMRSADGRLGVMAARANEFAFEQWSSADGAAFEAGPAKLASRCDRLGCVAALADGRFLSLVLDAAAFDEDCNRSAILVTRLAAPEWCTGPLVVDGERLRRVGATALTFAGSRIHLVTARGPDSDRPWSPAPPPGAYWRPEASPPAAEVTDDAAVAPLPAEPVTVDDRP